MWADVVDFLDVDLRVNECVGECVRKVKGSQLLITLQNINTLLPTYLALSVTTVHNFLSEFHFIENTDSYNLHKSLDW